MYERGEEILKELLDGEVIQHERRRVEKLKNVRETGKGGKRCNKRNGVLRTGG